MSYISIIKPPLTNNAAFAGKNGKGSQLSWYNEISRSNIIKSYFDGVNYVPDPDIDFLTDYLSTTTYVSKLNGDLSIEIEDQASSSFLMKINHCAFGGINFSDSDIIRIDIYISGDVKEYTLAATFDTSSRVSFYNAKPFMMMFDAIYSDVRYLRVDFVTGDSQFLPVSLTNFYTSKTMEFPSSPAVGFQKASWNTDDEAIFSRRQNNAFGASTIKRQGTTEVVKIPVVPIEFMDNDWTVFIRKYEYIPVFFSWSLEEFPLDTIHGNLRFDKASYVSSLFSEISFNISGVV